jgi:hypothetical protein
LQEELELFKDAGLALLACKACTDMFAKSDQPEAMGVPLTEMLQDGWTCLTYYR